MWWINKNGNIEGPFSAEQLLKRVKLNMLRSIDKVSEDKIQWFYVKDTAFWNPRKTIADHAQQEHRQHRISTKTSNAGSDFDAPMRARSADDNHRRSPAIPERFRLRADTNKVPQNRGLIRALVSAVVIALTGFGIMTYFAIANAKANTASSRNGDIAENIDETYGPTSSHIGFNAVKDKLVIIECNDGRSGSGFLLELDGKTYLMTNEHVVRSTKTPSARLLDGTPLSLGKFSVAQDRDLARFQVLGCSIKPFKLSDMLPNTGDTVAVYGNSLGGGVATESKGFIQGVGPLRIETNCEIVPGNSGSPLVASDGKVLAVAAFIDRSGSDEWTVKNTRYESSPRRFAIRFTSVAWKDIDRSRYEQQIASLYEFEQYWEYLFPYLCLDSVAVDESKLVFNDMMRKNFTLRKYGYDDILASLAKVYKKRTKSVVQWAERCKARKDFIQRLIDNDVSEADGRRAINEYDQKTVEMFEKVKESFRSMILKRKEALLAAQSILKEGPWDAPQVMSGYSRDDNSGSVEWYLDGVQYFMDLMNQKLNDLNKDIEAIEKGGYDEDDE